MSQQTAGWDVIPFESSKTVKPSLFLETWQQAR